MLGASRPLIYLDQSHFSRLAKHRAGLTTDSDYGALLAVLERGDGICPYSMWHLFETARCPDALRSEIEATIGGLSRGYCWRSLDDLVPDEIHATLDPTVVVTAIGRGAECFPMTHVEPLVHRVLASGSPESWFGFLTAVASDPSLSRIADQFSDATHARETQRVPVAKALAVPLEEVRELERVALSRNFLPSLAPALARRLSVSLDVARDLLLSQGLAASRSLSITIEALARHASKDGRIPRRSDGMDWGHMSLFAHADYVLTEHYDREIFEGACRHLKLSSTRCVSKASELTALLSR